jgi:hypothetical protein
MNENERHQAGAVWPMTITTILPNFFPSLQSSIYDPPLPNRATLG